MPRAWASKGSRPGSASRRLAPATLSACASCSRISAGSQSGKTSRATCRQLRWDFHAVCYRGGCRPRLLAEVERLFWRAERYNHLVLSSAERFRRSVAYYHEFFAACERRDPLEAERVMHASIRGAVDMIGPTLPSEAEGEEDLAG